MIDRRTFVGSAAAAALSASLAGCGGEGATGAAPVAAVPQQPAVAPVLAPRVAGGGGWLLEGDSYMIAQQAWNIAAALSEPAIYAAQGGSTLQNVRDRILARPDLRANPLLIWDGSANGHIDGTYQPELRAVVDIVAFKGEYRNWLLIPSVPVFAGSGPAPANAAIVTDLAGYGPALVMMFGGDHVFDAMPVLRPLADASAEDAADIAAGFVPRSVVADGTHLTDRAKAAIATALTAPRGPMAVARAL